MRIRNGTAAALAALLAAGCGGDAGNQAAVNTDSQINSAAREREEAALIETADLLPPGAGLVSRAPVEGAIAFDFESTDPPERLAEWYSAPRPNGGFSVTGEMEEGDERVLSGTTLRPPGDFSVRMAPDGRGGTTAIVLVTPQR